MSLIILDKLKTSLCLAKPRLKLARLGMSDSAKRETEESGDQPDSKSIKVSESGRNSRFSELNHSKRRLIPMGTYMKLSPEDIELIENVKTSCLDLDRTKAAIQLRRKHRLSIRLPEDMEDSSYYFEDGLRRVYPYYYLYQTYVKRRWVGRKLKDVIKEEFRDISDEQLKQRFDKQLILVNGETAIYNHVLRDNDFIVNRTHRHELPVLATPINIIYQDKETLVINKPPSIPIHTCGRYRHNTVINIMEKQYGLKDLRVVHRLDRLVSGVLIIALNATRARHLESCIKSRNVQKEYVCRVEGKFPDEEIVVDQPLESIPGKIGLTVCLPEGKDSKTTFKRLNYNGKTSAVLCKPHTGRMHQIRVHLQYLGYPIANDVLYNCDAFGSEKGKGGKYGKSLKQLSADVIAKHRENTWMIEENSDIYSPCEESCKKGVDEKDEDQRKVAKFVSDEEREETMAALQYFFTNNSWQDMQLKWKFDPNKQVHDETCRDCVTKYHDPPLRSLFLYLHALKYSGAGWCYESELPSWARDDWHY